MTDHMNGTPVPPPRPETRPEHWDQVELFEKGFQFAIDNIAKDIASRGEIVQFDAVIIGLSRVLGQQLGRVKDRNTRRVILGKSDVIVRQIIQKLVGG